MEVRKQANSTKCKEKKKNETVQRKYVFFNKKEFIL